MQFEFNLLIKTKSVGLLVFLISKASKSVNIFRISIVFSFNYMVSQLEWRVQIFRIFK